MDTSSIEPKIGDFPFTGECRAAALAFQTWKDRLMDMAVDHPLESLFVVLTGGALVMYLAEKDENEGFNTYDDALYYISTCLSVGYANVFPKTQLGKLVAAIVMAVGPSLSSWLIEGRLTARGAQAGAAPPPPAPNTNMEPLLERLDAILQELKAQRAGGAAETSTG